MSQAFLALSQWEGPALLWIQEDLRREWLDPVVSFFTHLGDHGLLWIVLTALLLLWPRTRRLGAAMALALVCSLLLTNGVLKHLFQRTRPWLLVDGLTPLVAEPDPNSFPSGHTSAAFAAATPLLWGRERLLEGWERRRAGLSLLPVLAALMGLSRLYVGVHFPTDVAVGCLVGCLCGLLGYLLEGYLSKRRPGPLI